jgi:hypothetical protein
MKADPKDGWRVVQTHWFYRRDAAEAIEPG